MTATLGKRVALKSPQPKTFWTISVLLGQEENTTNTDG